MKNENEKQTVDTNRKSEERKRDYLLPVSILVSVLIFSGALIYATGLKPESDDVGIKAQQGGTQAVETLSEVVTSPTGAILPARWGSLGMRMVAAGVVDESQFNTLYASQGGLLPDEKALLDVSDNGNIAITPENSGVILNLLWAFGLGNKNPILENGPMRNPQYGDAGNFASTGGWTLAQGNAMSHYSAHQFVTLTTDEQVLVEQVAKNIYRPCCGNPVYFPDCNHGMAMLGLLELMASQGATESETYKAALAANSYWFPDNYVTIARYLQSKGIDWKTVNPKDILSAAFSSSEGYAQIVAQTQPVQGGSSGSCGT